MTYRPNHKKTQHRRTYKHTHIHEYIVRQIVPNKPKKAFSKSSKDFKISLKTKVYCILLYIVRNFILTLTKRLNKTSNWDLAKTRRKRDSLLSCLSFSLRYNDQSLTSISASFSQCHVSERERERTNGGLFRQTKTSKNRLESKQAYIGRYHSICSSKVKRKIIEA